MRTIILLFLISIAITACDTDSEPVVLPTRVMVNTEVAPAPTIEEIQDETETVIAPTSMITETAEITVVASQTPIVETTTQNPEDQSQIVATEDSTDSSFGLTQFDSIQSGDQVLLTGLFQVIQEDEVDVVIITDEDDNSLYVDIPPAMALDFSGSIVQINGEVTTVNDKLQIVPQAILKPDEDTTDQNPIIAPDDSVELLPEFNTNETLTALQIYDSLLNHKNDELDNLEWIALSGSSQSMGWTFIFKNPQTDEFMAYFVDVSGVLQYLGSVPPPLQATNLPIDRSKIMIDSDQAAVLVAEAGGPPITMDVILDLKISDSGTIVWTAVGTEIDPFDATTK